MALRQVGNGDVLRRGGVTQRCHSKTRAKIDKAIDQTLVHGRLHELCFPPAPPRDLTIVLLHLTLLPPLDTFIRSSPGPDPSALFHQHAAWRNSCAGPVAARIVPARTSTGILTHLSGVWLVVCVVWALVHGNAGANLVLVRVSSLDTGICKKGTGGPTYSVPKVSRLAPASAAAAHSVAGAVSAAFAHRAAVVPHLVDLVAMLITNAVQYSAAAVLGRG